ncbi:IclR family transcriptional regulator [Protaetiibacter sp. SSC-01]|uniref:IclR family transcriptional regulator n=1 Tax=Protaetiibacter sp. SSC-01 TaxID=2759943 RepID=UPI00165752C1|nr:IclR family transcriptional regulator [Protaetiibacter sp. SSC-01]QNO37879.1 IclR family transcriptional regulator [Protaetiibacter sp. SSC-01]
MIQAIDRAAKVLQSLQGARHLGISELAAALDLPPSTVHGIVKSLQEHGLVAKERNGQRYMLGPALVKLSNVYLDTLDVRARAMRWTRELSRRTGLAVRLGVELFDEVLVIHHNRRPDGSQQMLETGMTIPAHASAMGKVLLAFDDEYQSVVLSRQLQSLTGDTVTDPAQLTLAFAGIVERGFATEEDEAVLGESSVAAPVGDASGELVAAVAVVLPSTEWPPADGVLNDLRETARNISRELGATSWPPRVAPREGA